MLKVVRRYGRRHARAAGQVISGYATGKTLAQRAGKKTKTKTRVTRKKLTNRVKVSKDDPVSDSFFSHVYGKPLPKMISKFAGHSRLVENEGSYGVWAAGQQNLMLMNACYTPVQLEDMYSAYSSLQANSTVQNTAKFFLKQCKGEIMITNQTNDLVNMTLYDVVARRDSSVGYEYDPVSAWENGIADAGVSNGYRTVGNTPFGVPLFTTFWKVLKVTKVDLHSGGHHRHTVLIKPQRILSREIWAGTGLGSASYSSCIGGVTHYTVAVCHGYPVHVTGGTSVSTAKGQIDFVSKREYEWEVIQQNKTVDYQDNSLTLFGTQPESFITDAYATTATITTAT